MKEQRIFIEITEFDDGSRMYAVGGGVKNDGQIESFHTPNECLIELKERVVDTLSNM